MFLGVWRFGISQPQINENHIAFYNNAETQNSASLQNQSIEFIGQIIDEPDVRPDKTKLTIGRIKITEARKMLPVRGKVLINLPNYPQYSYSDWLRINCELQKPGKINDFDYSKFLAVKGIYSVCYQTDELVLIGGEISGAQKFRKQILMFKRKFKVIIDKSVVYPQSEILSAMILGLRRGIPQNILNNFLLTASVY